MATAKEVINAMKSFEGMNEKDGSFLKILEIYNKHRPLARGYKLKPTDEWCAGTISSAFIKAHAVNCIGGTECGVERFIEDVFKPKGIWIENGKIRPKAGDVICYNWDDSSQPNDGRADHIGLVIDVSGKYMTVLEGNKNEVCARRTIPIGWGYIRGFARPKYSTKPKKKPKKSVNKIALEVLEGKWGVGSTRKERLEKAGYNYKQVQERVNQILNGK